MKELMPLEQFKQTQTIKYGTAATSASANHAPIFIKEELNSLYNYTKMKFSELPLEWDPEATYKIGDVVAHNGDVYEAIADNGNQEPPGVAWALFDTASLDLELKYVQIHTDKYINLFDRNSYKMMRANENSTTAIMSPKNGLVPWDDGTSSDLGTSNLRWNDIYCVNGHYSSINTGSITATTGSIGDLSGTSLDFNSGDIGSLSGNVLNYNTGTIDSITATSISVNSITASGKITADTMEATTFDGTSTRAKYADLAEKYESDVEYAPGSVLGFGGDKEITIYNKGLTLAGVVSTQPGYMLNSELSNGVYIALKGRVPCKIIGDAKAGMYILASNDGLGIAVDNYSFEESKILLGVAISNSKDGIVEIKV